MTESEMDGRIRRWLEDREPGEVPASMRETVAGVPYYQPRVWRPGFAAAVAAGAVVVVVTLLGYQLLVAPNVGGPRPNRLPPVTGPAANGLVAYSAAGDIYIGDPITGETTAIVTGPEADSSPMFSPDGTQVAFLRGDQGAAPEAMVLVVQADGSNPRVVMPAGYSARGATFAWTPDSASLVLNHDSEPFTTPYFDGELSLLDASGIAQPRLLTPPLPIAPGGPYLTGQVATMFRPPNADLILSTTHLGCSAGELRVWDANLEGSRPLAPEIFRGYEPCGVLVSPWDLHWSPDGTMIAVFAALDPDGSIDNPYPLEQAGSYVMKADGSDARRLPAIGPWSPDGTRMAYSRCTSEPDGDQSVIVIVDIASGAERVLEATSVRTKTEGLVPSPAAAAEPVCGWFAWDYEGWSWSPDGRSIVFLELTGSRPVIVDAETGEASELPWVSDSAPSWQRVSLD